MWVYIHSEHSSEHDLYTTGFYDPNGKWHSDEDYNTKIEAAERVHYLNGSANGGTNKIAPIAFTALVDMSNEFKSSNPDIEWIKTKLDNLISHLS